MSRIARVPRQPGTPGQEPAPVAGGAGRPLPVLANPSIPIAVARSAALPPADAPLSRYWQVLQRRWALGLVIFLVIVVGVSLGAWLKPSVYRASALLEIRPDSAGAVPVEALFSADKVPTDELETQYGILKSRTLAELVLLDVQRYTATQATPAPPGASQGAATGTSGTTAPVQRAAASASPAAAVAKVPPAPAIDPDQIDGFLGTLVVNPQRGSRLVELEFVSPDPRLAAFTLNSFLDNYLKIRMDEAQRSASWLQGQIDDAQRRLEASERQIQAYIRKHGLQGIETGKGETADLANQRLKTLRDALAQAQAIRMDRQAADEETRRAAATAGVDSPVAQQLTVRLADLRREHARLAASFKEDYPAVKAVSDQITELEAALGQETRMVIARGQREYQAALGKEALLAQALEQQDALVRELSDGSAGDAGYEALKRELVTNQEQFTALGQKLKEVRIAAALKASNVGVIDRAAPPEEPDGIPLPITVALAAMIGLVVAGGGIVIREQFDTSMRSFNDVETQLGVRTLAAIPAFGRRLRVLPSRADAPDRRVWRRIDERGAQRSALADAFAALRNAVILQDGEGAARVLLITSTQSAEGKTTINEVLRVTAG
jgi:uncharacterized protein involved in exopolysaccharide biosynthesis